MSAVTNFACLIISSETVTGSPLKSFPKLVMLLFAAIHSTMASFVCFCRAYCSVAILLLDILGLALY